MKLLIIRHGIAVDREAFGRDGQEDAQRPLTRRGRRRMKRAARGLARLEPGVGALATSPLVRAVQTGEIVASAYQDLTPVQIPQLLPRKPVRALLSWLNQQDSAATVALVGHEPHLGLFASWMLTGLQDSFVVLKKGGACLLELEGELGAGRAKLSWLLKASQLRDLASP